MTTCEPTSNIKPDAIGQAGSSRWVRIEDWLERSSERLNPILVKEARQALKSRQFLITFSLLLLFAWGWSLIGIAMLMPGVYYASGGRFMLVGYYLVLALPLLVVVPFSAFRSIASEQEDGTYELLTVTSLSSRQIVTGKLGSAVLQMIVYFSALSPCIAFTYMLRGLDVFAILLILGYAFLASLWLSVVGLLFGTLTRSRHWQALLSVVFLAGLGVFALVWCQATMAIFLVASLAVDQWSFWASNLGVISMIVSFMVLGIFAAASQISFASENRSTRLRAIMLGQQVLFLGWMTYVWLVGKDYETLLVMVGIAGAYWMAIGALLVGEAGQLSPRARRALPRSFLGRAGLTWFNPGSGTGYLFAVLNLFTVVAVCMALLVGAEVSAFSGKSNSFVWAIFASLVLAYVTIFLGIGRLVILALRKFGMAPGMLMSVLLQVVMLVSSAFLPFFIQSWLSGFSRPEYSVLQSVNWFWTLGESLEGMLRTLDVGLPWGGSVSSGFAAAALVWVTAMLVFLVNLVLAGRDINVVRAGTPDRVLQDNQVLRPEREKPVPVRKSPFDD